MKGTNKNKPLDVAASTEDFQLPIHRYIDMIVDDTEGAEVAVIDKKLLDMLMKSTPFGEFQQNLILKLENVNCYSDLYQVMKDNMYLVEVHFKYTGYKIQEQRKQDPDDV
jgi:hypothetical protein